MAKPDIDALEGSSDALKLRDEIKIRYDKATTAGDTEAVAEFEAMRVALDKRLATDIEWDEKDFVRNKPALANFKTFWEGKNKKEWTGGNDGLANEFKSTMGWFDWNLANTAKVAIDAQSWDEDTITSFGQMMDDYKKLDLGTLSTLKNAGRLAADPTTWIGLGTGALSFGTGTAATAAAVQASKYAARQTIRALIAKTLKTKAQRFAATGALEGGAYAGVDDALRQEVEDPDASYDVGRGLTATGIGAATGGALGGSITKLAQLRRVRTGKADLEDLLDAERVQQHIEQKALNIRKDKVITGAVENNISDWSQRAADKLRSSLPGAGNLAANVVEGVAKQGRPPLDRATLNNHLSQIALLELKKRSGAKMFGAGMASAAQQAHKNDLLKSAISGGFKLLTGFGPKKYAIKGTRGIGRNIFSPVKGHKARQFAKTNESIADPLSEVGLVERANQRLRLQESSLASGLPMPVSLPVRQSSPTAQLRPTQEAPEAIQRPLSSKPQTGSKPIPVASVDSTAQVAAQATRIANVESLISKGKVPIKGNLTKAQLQIIEAGHATAQVNKKTGRIEICQGLSCSTGPDWQKLIVRGEYLVKA